MGWDELKVVASDASEDETRPDPDPLFLDPGTRTNRPLSFLPPEGSGRGPLTCLGVGVSKSVSQRY